MYLDKVMEPKDIKKMDYLSLDILSGEIRDFLIDSVSKTGGHLASNLGIVELTLAVHRVFDSPIDKIIWDVGHQAYVHKIITGRKDQFNTLRKFKGLSGFPKIEESEHDIFNTGHSSTSISCGLGMAKARDLKNENNHILSIIGDGALSGGMAFEALNDAGFSKTRLIVILNDNEMSISPNVGGMSMYLSRLRTKRAYISFKRLLSHILVKVPFVGKKIKNFLERTRDRFKHLLLKETIFEDLGFVYLGPVDGHNIKKIEKALKSAKNLEKPCLVHVRTKKGKGFSHAENKPHQYHGVSCFDPLNGIEETSSNSFSNTFGSWICEKAKKHSDIVAITAAMVTGTGLYDFSLKFPERFFDVAIAEQHGMGFCAGISKNGLRPFFAIYSSFLQRAYDQVIHDIALQNLPVVICVDRSGFVGGDGETHQGLFDVSFLRNIPNMTVFTPSCTKELERVLDFTYDNMSTPVAIRYPKGDNNYTINLKDDYNPFEINCISKGDKIGIITYGRIIKQALKAADELKDQNLDIKILNLSCISPLDKKGIMDECKDLDYLIVLEESYKMGGIGQEIMTMFKENNIDTQIHLMAVENEFVRHGSIEQLIIECKLDSISIVDKIKDYLKNG